MAIFGDCFSKAVLTIIYSFPALYIRHTLKIFRGSGNTPFWTINNYSDGVGNVENWQHHNNELEYHQRYASLIFGKLQIIILTNSSAIVKKCEKESE